MTQRHRRSKQEQARDVLTALLRTQEARTAKRKAIYEQAEAEAEKTRTALEVLGVSTASDEYTTPWFDAGLPIMRKVVLSSEAEVVGGLRPMPPVPEAAHGDAGPYWGPTGGDLLATGKAAWGRAKERTK